MNVSPSTPLMWLHLQQLLRLRLLRALITPQPDADRIAQLRQALWNVDELLQPTVEDRP